MLQVVLIGVGMVAVNHYARVCYIKLLVELINPDEILVVVVRQGVAMLIDETTQDGMSIGVALTLDLPASVLEGMGLLGGIDGIHHDG